MNANFGNVEGHFTSGTRFTGKLELPIQTTQSDCSERKYSDD